ncbi:unnamed protein product [Ilex paraguariensis]|uniref:RING-type domain-containing protein n=1 Tax=Ilex paraguariensis TaxID=185542 RepID=A0ABC8T4H2_9AQUA
MASMVAKACGNSSQMSPAITVQEKGSRNKRKFRADPPLADPNKFILSPQNACASYEFSAEKFEIIPTHGHLDGCDMCSVDQDHFDALKLDLGLSCAVGSSEVQPSRLREDIEATDEFHDADWSDLTESQLEELVLSNLDTIFKSAIKKIVASGYSEEVATKAVLRSGLCYGCKDTVSNIVDNTLGFLKSDQDFDPSREQYFEDLQQMEKYILAEMVCVLREVRPFFSTGDAMWCLLICDLNVTHACAMDCDPLNSLVGDGAPNRNASISGHPQLRTESKSFELNLSDTCKPNSSTACDHSCPSETPTMASISCAPSLQAESTMAGISNLKPKTSFAHNRLALEKDYPNFTSDATDKSLSLSGASHSPVPEEKFGTSRKISGTARREYILRQKSMHLEKHHRTYGSKGATRAGKLSSFGGLILDKKLKSVSEATGVTVKGTSLKISNAVGVDVPQGISNHNLSTNIELPPPSTISLETANGNCTSILPKTNIPSALPTISTPPVLSSADTELSLSLPSQSNSAPMLISCNAEAPNCDHTGILFDKSLGQWIPLDKKDETILKLGSRVRELQNQLQEWTEWANQKVMQATRRLSKDKAELKTLRQEKEEVERLKKEKQALEENTLKKLSEMENALCKASGQVDRANTAVCRLGVENAALRQEMEVAKLRAAESAASCQEVSKREKKTLMNFQSWEKQKTLFHEELAAEKRKLAKLQKELDRDKDLRDQHEAVWKQEEKAKEELLTQTSSLKKEREQIEASAKSKEDMITVKAESNLQKYKSAIEKLEKEISQLRLKTDSLKIAALKRGIDGSYAGRLIDLQNAPAPKESQIPYISKIVGDFKDYSGDEGVKRERECVMCLSEEMSVVFIPCAHQVVCTTCNELHEKQGMKDCPSCRSPIQQRICVRYARP